MPPKKKMVFPGNVNGKPARQAFCRAVAEASRLAYNAVAARRRAGEIDQYQIEAAREAMQDDFLAIAVEELPIRGVGPKIKPSEAAVAAVKLDEVLIRNPVLGT